METHLFKKKPLPYIAKSLYAHMRRYLVESKKACYSKSNGNSLDTFVPIAVHYSVSSCLGHSQVLEPQFSCEIAEYHLTEIPRVWPLPPMTNSPLIETQLMSLIGHQPPCRAIL